MEHFWISPPAGRVAGGELIKIDVQTDESLHDVGVQFGEKPARVSKIDLEKHTISVETPPYDGKGNVIEPGAFEQQITLVLHNGTRINDGSRFVYLDRRVPEVGTATPRTLTLQPSFKNVGEGVVITIVADWLKEPGTCATATVYFNGQRQTVLRCDPANGSLEIMAPEPKTAESVTVEVRVPGSGRRPDAATFLYIPAPAQKDTNDASGLLATVTIGLLLSVQLCWAFKRLDNALRPATPHESEGHDDAESRNAAIARTLDENRLEINEVVGSLSKTADSLSKVAESLSDQMARTVAQYEQLEMDRLNEEQRREQQREEEQRQARARNEPPAQVPLEKNDRKSSSVQTARNKSHEGTRAAACGQQTLTEMWNAARYAGQSTTQFIADLNAAWIGQVTAGESKGLILVTASAESHSWVLPSMQPLVHESTIQEYFDVRLAKNVAPRLVRPASVPKGTDLHGFTAGQIQRGVLES